MTETTALRREGTAPEATRNPPGLRWLAVGLFALGAGAASVALLGPLAGDVIEYHVSDGAANQIIGGDVAALLLVAPVSVLAGVLSWRGRLAGPVLALGPAAYALYMYSQLALGGDVARYPGNTEQFFPLFLAVFLIAGGVALGAWEMIEADQLPVTSRRVGHTAGIFFLVVAVFLTFGLHLPGLVGIWSGEPGTEYVADPVVFWLVKFMDLGVVVPVMALVGVGILRGRAWASKIKYAVVGWSALLGTSVAGMAIAMQATNDPAATLANTIAFSAFAAVAIVIAWIVYRPLFVDSASADPDARGEGR